MSWKLPWNGGCRCGQLRFTVTAEPLLSSACHCNGCQKMTASAFSLSIAVPRAGFAITAGEPVIGGLHGKSKHYMCKHCLSWVFTYPEGLDELANIRATMLDDHAWFQPFVDMNAAEKLPWATTGAKHSYPTFPANDEFPAVIAEFAKEGARP